MTRSRLDRVRHAVEAAAVREGLTLDRDQRVLLDRLVLLGGELAGSPQRPGARRRPVRGLYVWGPAGRGKSWLASAFVAALAPELPAVAVRRAHVYDLFRALHAAIHAHRLAALAGARPAVGQRGPTRGWRTRQAPQGSDRRADGAAPDASTPPGDEPVDLPPGTVDAAIDDLLHGTTLLCLDELHLHDSGDATLLTRLLRRAFDAGVVVLATSNYQPEALLPNPLWHHLAEPGIALLRAHLDVVELAGPTDYRTLGARGRGGFSGGRWLSPGTTAQLAAHGLVPPGPDATATIRTGTREFVVTAARGDHGSGAGDSGGELWATFEELAVRPTSTLEYLDWAARFCRWVVTDVPLLTDVDREAQQRFIAVVDVLCDADVGLVVTSPHDLATFRAALPDRPDAYRMTSRLLLLGD